MSMFKCLSSVVDEKKPVVLRVFLQVRRGGYFDLDLCVQDV
jgi:hypothetical protein